MRPRCGKWHHDSKGDQGGPRSCTVAQSACFQRSGCVPHPRQTVRKTPTLCSLCPSGGRKCIFFRPPDVRQRLVCGIARFVLCPSKGVLRISGSVLRKSTLTEPYLVFVLLVGWPEVHLFPPDGRQRLVRRIAHHLQVPGLVQQRRMVHVHRPLPVVKVVHLPRTRASCHWVPEFVFSRMVSVCCLLAVVVAVHLSSGERPPLQIWRSVMAYTCLCPCLSPSMPQATSCRSHAAGVGPQLRQQRHAPALDPGPALQQPYQAIAPVSAPLCRQR